MTSRIYFLTRKDSRNLRLLKFLIVVIITGLISTTANSQVKIRERVKITPATILQNASELPDNEYNGRIYFTAPGTLRLRQNFNRIGYMACWWFGPYFNYTDADCSYCSIVTFGPIIRTEGIEPGFSYNAKDAFYQRTMDSTFFCGAGTYWTLSYDDPFWNKDWYVDLGYFHAGDSVTITIGVPDCEGLTYRARNVTLSYTNSAADLCYRIDHPYTTASCDGVVSDPAFWGPYYGYSDLRWLSVEVPDMPELCTVVNVSKAEINPGDTDAINIMGLQSDGALIEYPPETNFSIWMNSDESYGFLRSLITGDEGSYLYGQQPFEFVAADSIDADSVVAEIEAYPEGAGGGGGAGSIKNEPIDTHRLPAGLMVKMRNSSHENQQASNSEKKGTYSIDTTSKVRSSIRSAEKLKKRLFDRREIAKNKSQFDRIIGYVETRLANLNRVMKDASNSPESRAKLAQIEATAIEGGESCRIPVADVTIKSKPELVVDTLPDDQKIQKIEGTNLPKMPKPLIKAYLKNYDGGDVDFNWELKIKWKSDRDRYVTPNDTTESYKGDASGANSDTTDLEIGEYLYGEANMRGGNQITLHVEATTKKDEKKYTTDVSNPFIIKGQNPSKATVLAELKGDEYAAIASYESHFNQFAKLSTFKTEYNTTPDFPLQGGDHQDFGMMQINSPWYYPNNWYYNNNDYDCDDIIWNWVTNVQQGKLYFRYCYDNDATNYHLDYRDPTETAKNTPLDEEERYCEAYCEYNGGIGAWYWDWKPPDVMENKPGYWARSTEGTGKNITARDYADDVDSLRINHPWR